MLKNNILIYQLNLKIKYLTLGGCLLFLLGSPSLVIAKCNPGTIGATSCNNQCCFSADTIKSIQDYMKDTTRALYPDQNSILVSRWATQKAETATTQAFESNQVDQLFLFYANKAVNNPAYSVAGPGMYVSLPLRLSAEQARLSDDAIWQQLLEAADSAAPIKKPRLFFFELDLDSTTFIRINEIYAFLQSLTQSRNPKLKKSSSQALIPLLNSEITNLKELTFLNDERDTTKHFMGCCLDGFTDLNSIITSYDDYHTQWAVIRGPEPIRKYLTPKEAYLPLTRAPLTCPVIKRYLSTLPSRPKRNDALVKYVTGLKSDFCLDEDQDNAGTTIASLCHKVSYDDVSTEIEKIFSTDEATHQFMSPGRRSLRSPRSSGSLSVNVEGSYTPQRGNPKKHSQGSSVTPSSRDFASSYTPTAGRPGRNSERPQSFNRKITPSKNKSEKPSYLPPITNTVSVAAGNIKPVEPKLVRKLPLPALVAKADPFQILPIEPKNSILHLFQDPAQFNYKSSDWDEYLIQDLLNPGYPSSLDLFTLLSELNPGFKTIFNHKPTSMNSATFESRSREVLRSFNDRIAQDPSTVTLAMGSSRIKPGILRLAVALHDIGVPFSSPTSKPFDRAQLILSSLHKTINFIGPEEHAFLEAFILNNCVGNYIKTASPFSRKLSMEPCSTKADAAIFLQKLAKQAEMPPRAFFRLISAYYFSNELHNGPTPFTAEKEERLQKHLKALEILLPE